SGVAYGRVTKRIRGWSLTWWPAATRRRAAPTWSLPATVTLLSGRRTSARTMLFCAPWTASLTMLWSLPLRERASGAGSWRRLPCVLLLAHRLTRSRPGKQYYLGAGYPRLVIFV